VTKIRNEELISAFGKRVMQLRMSKGLSQYELADLANINRSQIIGIESGRINTTISTAKCLAEALDLSLGDLFQF
jgi:transcriptional regulator with XRE-family HTH domain